MALTQISTAGVKDDAVTAGKIPANAVGSSELADNAVDTNAIQDDAVTAAKLANTSVTAASYGSSTSIPSITVDAQGRITAASGNTVNTDLVADTSPQLGGDLSSNSRSINFGDSSGGGVNRAQFGDSNDLKIFHSTSGNSMITNSTGEFLIESNGNIVLEKVGASEVYLKAIPDGAVELYHNGSKKVETNAGGLKFNSGSGNLISYGTTSEFPNAAINIYRGGNGYANIRLSSNYGCGLYMAGASDNTDEFGINQDNQKIGYLDNRGGAIKITTGSSALTRLTFENSYTITSVCDFVPSSNNAKDLGTTSLRWRNIYTNDLNLSNEGSSNDVDQTWGNWTIQEGESDLFLKNNRSGKKYKFNLTEVS